MADIKCLQDWVTHEMVRGRYIFTKEDVLNLHLPISDQALQNSLTRHLGKTFTSSYPMSTS